MPTKTLYQLIYIMMLLITILWAYLNLGSSLSTQSSKTTHQIHLGNSFESVHREFVLANFLMDSRSISRRCKQTIRPDPTEKTARSEGFSLPFRPYSYSATICTPNCVFGIRIRGVWIFKPRSPVPRDLINYISTPSESTSHPCGVARLLE